MPAPRRPSPRSTDRKSTDRRNRTMKLPVNAFKRALKEGRPQIGLWSMLSSNIVAEIVAPAGFDWVVLDTEHSPNELPRVLQPLQAMTKIGSESCRERGCT